MRQYPAAAVAARPGGPGGGPHYLGTCRTHDSVLQSEVGVVFW
jgi:hypothetical protein